ncbi:SGNH/GDSL hydrolase family protein [Ilumatobacter sp.]|uniref:SGNH/GDSL hydrolase family protein n=1 Tax=Ilumatobacter sp. TaxID=1967498 RepID=UPI003AF4A1C5
MTAPNRRSRAASPRRMAALALVGALILSIVAAASRPEQADAALANSSFDPTPRPHGAVTIIGDSVLQGSFIVGPTLTDRLAENGWGPIRGRAGVGYSTGIFATATEARATYWIDMWRRQGWDAPNVFVNLGANDSGRCDVDLACARDAILHLVTAIGPGHRIWWPKVTRHPLFQHQADNWNLALEQIADERADFFTWDWPFVMATEGLATGDNTHLTSEGYRTRSRIMAHEFSADLVFATRTGGDAPLATPTGAPSELVPIGPVRVIDTRIDPPGRVAADTAIVVDVSDHVPAGTTAIAAYVSATNTAGPGFLTAYDCSTGRPTASAANHAAGATRGAVAITPIADDGTFCLYTLAEADLLVDLQAAFVPVGGGGLRFDPLDTPSRLVDTRETGRSEVIEIDAPAGADAVAISLTAVFGDRFGFLTAYPCSDDIPVVATVNYGPAELISGTAFLPVSDRGTICVYVLNSTDVTVDLTGTFSADADLVFQPAAPTRMIDTRYGTGGWEPVQGRFQTIDARVAPPEAEAVSGTLTMVTPLRTGFVRAWGCGSEPETANVTAVSGAVLANSLTTGVSADGRLCVMARVATSTVFDTSGWWVPG